jgi:hypothetical protein
LPAGFLNAMHQDYVVNLSHRASVLAGNLQSKCGNCVRNLLEIFDSITIRLRTQFPRENPVLRTEIPIWGARSLQIWPVGIHDPFRSYGSESSTGPCSIIGGICLGMAPCAAEVEVICAAWAGRIDGNAKADTPVTSAQA